MTDGRSGLGEEFIKISFAISNIDQQGLRTLRGQLLTGTEALEPFDTLLLFDRSLMTLLGRAHLRAGLTPVMDQTQSLAGGSDGQGGVGEQADGAMPTGADRTESLGGAMGGIIQTGGVLQRQNDAVRAQPFHGGVLMALQDLLRFYGLIFKKPISCFGRGPPTARLRNGGRRLASKSRSDSSQSFGEPLIGHLAAAEFVYRPLIRSAWSRTSRRNKL